MTERIPTRPNRRMAAKMCAASMIVAFALGGCESAPTQKLPDLTYSHLPAINFAAGRREISDRFRPKMGPPSINHLVPAPPAKALARWAQDRIQATGGRDTVRFVIIDATVTETPLKKQEGFKAGFTKQQSERYDARIEAAVEIVDPLGAVRGRADAVVTRSITVREDATLSDRAKIQFDLVEALMKDFDAEIEKNLRQYVPNWLR